MDKTKEKIMSKAIEMFFEQGIKETTMDNLSGELGMSKKTLYKYFAHKDDLVYESVRFLFKKISAELDRIEQEDLNPYEDFFKVRQMINSMVRQSGLATYEQFKKYYPDLVEEMERNKRERIFAFLENNFDKGIRAGFYKKNLQRDFYKRIFFGFKKIACDESIFPADPVKKFIYGEMFLKMFLQAISTKKGRKELKTILKKHKL